MIMDDLCLGLLTLKTYQKAHDTDFQSIRVANILYNALSLEA